MFRSGLGGGVHGAPRHLAVGPDLREETGEGLAEVRCVQQCRERDPVRPPVREGEVKRPGEVETLRTCTPYTNYSSTKRPSCGPREIARCLTPADCGIV